MESRSTPPVISESIGLDEVDSTNRYALDAGRPGLLVSARTQYAGRGRRGRPWFSPQGENLYMTITASPSEERYPIIAGVAVRSGIAGLIPSQAVEIKWPNDIIMAGKKVCGILCEARGGITAIGIGLNVNQEKWPPELEHRAISMSQASGRPFSVDEVKKVVADEFCLWMERFRSQGFEPVRQEFLCHGTLHSHEVYDEKGRRCTIEGMTADGHLLIRAAGIQRELLHEPVSLGWDEQG